eukprot:TRINITY_DN3063_c0_g1_i1.p1 TRINITY_DN3063_c0_g1~~TRINITY_DN3063_c0_g1_i1.p1  ORF type:complete len:145 (+),score=9.29 TRINITY_DN3063_c0_g1_i1:288-722(+)
MGDYADKVGMVVAPLLAYCFYAAVYVLDLCWPIKEIVPANYKPKNLLKASIKSNDGSYNFDKNELRTWIIKGYHQNMFFHTIACLIALASCAHPMMNVIAYIGTAALGMQIVSLYFLSNTFCYVFYSISATVNFILLTSSTLIY